MCDTLTIPIKIEEYFLELLKLNNTFDEGLFDESVNILKKIYKFDFSDIRG